jgi:hypothetical protein
MTQQGGYIWCYENIKAIFVVAPYRWCYYTGTSRTGIILIINLYPGEHLCKCMHYHRIDTGTGIECTRKSNIIMSRVIDPNPHPDPDWIRIKLLCGSGSALGTRIRIQGQENEEK